MQGNKKISLFVSGEKMVDSLEQKGLTDDDIDVWSESEDEFPKEKEMEALQQEK